MSAGLQTLSALITTQSRDLYRSMTTNFFVEDEVPAWNFFTQYTDRYGAFPSLQVMQENGFPLPEPSGTAQYHRDQLQDRFAYNHWMQHSEEFFQRVQGGYMSEARDILEDILFGWRGMDTVRDTFTLQDAISMVVEDYQIARDLHGQLRGITYGWSELDDRTGGCRDGDVATIVARPGAGKTFTILKMAAHAWEQGNPVVVVSMEMNAIEMARRILSMGSGVSADFIQRGTLSEWGEEVMMASVERVANMPPFHLLVGNLTKSVRDVDMLIQEHSPRAVYVDAGYLLNPAGKKPGARRFELAAETIRELKDLAMRRSKPIIQTVQFNRQQKQDEDMSLDNIGQTDEIGQISSLVLGMKKGAAPNESTRRRYTVVKNRHGEDYWGFETNFQHSPFNMDFIDEGDGGDNDPDGEYDGTQGDQPVTNEWSRV
jgi:replicative DNA helicase